MSEFFSGNLFDLAIYVCLFVAVVMGFMTGLFRSLARFSAICAASAGSRRRAKADVLAGYMKFAPPPTWVVLIATFVIAGTVIGALL